MKKLVFFFTNKGGADLYFLALFRLKTINEERTETRCSMC